MDLAEIPTFELFQQWGADADPRPGAEAGAPMGGNLVITVDGRPVAARVQRAAIVLAEGAGNMKVARVTAELQVDSAAAR